MVDGPTPVANLINNNPMDIDMDMDMYMKVEEGRTTCQRTSATATAKTLRDREVYLPTKIRNLLIHLKIIIICGFLSTSYSL